MKKYENFKLRYFLFLIQFILDSNSLNKLVEQDNVSYLKETDQKSRLLTAVNYLNVPYAIATGPGNFKRDDDNDDGNDGYPKQFDDFNRPIM